MPSRNESARALARLQLETPISNDANLLNLQKQVEDFVREARRRDPSEPNELVSTVVDTVARDYFRHAILKQRRLASLKGVASQPATRKLWPPQLGEEPASLLPASPMLVFPRRVEHALDVAVPSERGKGKRWSTWKKGTYKPKPRSPYEFS